MSIKEKIDLRKLLGKILLASVFLFSFPLSNIKANEEIKSVTYFTGIGCSHCSKVSPYLHEQVQENENLLLIEYEIYQERNNAPLIYTYAENYKAGLGVPMIIWTDNNYTAGDQTILKTFEEKLLAQEPNNILLSDNIMTIEELNVNNFSGNPKLFMKDKALVKVENKEVTGEHNQLLRKFITGNIDNVIDEIHGEFVANRELKYPGGEIEYEHALSLDGWYMLWNGPSANNANVSCEKVDVKEVQDPECKQDITIWKTVMLALTDSINPCALSVLTMMLIAIVTYHPKDKKQVLWSGIAFVAAVFVTYIIYGLLIVKAFQLLQSISTIKLVLYKGLGAVAIILGCLEIKDFFFYKPGSIGTEMPLSLRPKVQKLIARITSPWGAFSLGMFVTLFLLPCTIGPYIILGGILSVGGLWSSLPHLLLYNTIFVLPMLIVVLAIFFGTKQIKDLEEFREKNVRVMHLIIGLIFLILGVIMLTGIL